MMVESLMVLVAADWYRSGADRKEGRSFSGAIPEGGTKWRESNEDRDSTDDCS